MFSPKLILLLWAVFAPGMLRAQPGALDHCLRQMTGKSYAGRVWMRLCLYDALRAADMAEQKAILARLHGEATRRGDSVLHLYARTAYVHFVLPGSGDKPPVDSMLETLESVRRSAIRLNDAPHIAWAETNLAAAQFYKARQYDRAFETALGVRVRLTSIPDSAMPDRLALLGIIGNFYFDFGEYRQAVDVLAGEATAPPAQRLPALMLRHHYTLLGLCYRELGRYDSSNHCFNEALRQARRGGETAWVSILGGNLGINLYRQGRYAEATPLLQEDVRASAARSDWNNAAGSLLPLASIALERGRTTEATTMLNTARQYIALDGADNRLPLYHSLRIREAAASGDERRAARHADSLAAAKDSVAQQHSALHLARAEQRLQTAGIRADLAAAVAQKRMATLQRNALVTILFSGAGAMALGLLYIRRRRKEVAEKTAAVLRAKEAELIAAEDSLHRFRQDVQEKAALIEQLSAQLDETAHASILQQLRDATILTDAQWTDFRRMFEKVHVGFIARLQQQYPAISPAEIRFLALARLGFSTKEIGGALGISPSSVRVTWMRLRRKLELGEEVQVGALVEGI